MFVVFEGIDGAGKTTQCKMFVDYLTGQGENVLHTREPTDGKIGTMLQNLIKGKTQLTVEPETLALLFVADRMEHCRKYIEPALRCGRIVICDRYMLSTIAYQQAQGMYYDWLRMLHDRIFPPDLTFIIDTDIDSCIDRMLSRDLFERKDFLKRVRSHYVVHRNDRDTFIVNGNQSKDNIHTDIVTIFEGVSE